MQDKWILSEPPAPMPLPSLEIWYWDEVVTCDCDGTADGIQSWYERTDYLSKRRSEGI